MLVKCEVTKKYKNILNRNTLYVNFIAFKICFHIFHENKNFYCKEFNIITDQHKFANRRLFHSFNLPISYSIQSPRSMIVFSLDIISYFCLKKVRYIIIHHLFFSFWYIFIVCSDKIQSYIFYKLSRILLYLCNHNHYYCCLILELFSYLDYHEKCSNSYR